MNRPVVIFMDPILGEWNVGLVTVLPDSKLRAVVAL